MCPACGHDRFAVQQQEFRCGELTFGSRKTWKVKTDVIGIERTPSENRRPWRNSSV